MIGRIPILAVVVLGLTLTGVPAKAIPILSGTTWISTGDPIVGDNWITGSFTTGDGIAATAPYPNPVTTPDDILPGTLAELMWFCGACQDAGGTVTGSDGPTETFFRFTFDLPLNLNSPQFAVTAEALVIADDLFEFYVNGVFGLAVWMTSRRVAAITRGPKGRTHDFTVAVALRPGGNGRGMTRMEMRDRAPELPGRDVGSEPTG